MPAATAPQRRGRSGSEVWPFPVGRRLTSCDPERLGVRLSDRGSTESAKTLLEPGSRSKNQVIPAWSCCDLNTDWEALR